MVDIVVKVEAALEQGHVAGVGPVGDVDVVVLQETAHRAAQQGGVVARQGRHDQHGGAAIAAAGGGQVLGILDETLQLDPGRLPHRLHLDRHGPALNLDRIDAPVRLAVTAGHVGEDVGRGVDLAAQIGAGGRIERRAPEPAGRLGHQVQGFGGVIGGFVQGVEHEIQSGRVLRRNINSS